FIVALIARLELLWHTEASQTLAGAINTTQVVAGKVITDPDVRDRSVRVNLAVQTIASSTNSGTVLVVLPKNTHVAYGDALVVRGAVEAPAAFVTDTGRIFDYPEYL